VPALGWTAGIAAARVDSFPWQGLPWLAAAAAIALCRRRLRPFALALLAGTGWGAVTMLADASVADVDPLWTSASRCVVADVVRSRRGAATRLTLAHVRGRDGIGLDGNAWLYVYGRKGTSPHAGDHIRACAHWHRPRNHNNPGAFDFASYCFDRRIALIGGARGALTVLASHPGLFERLRERIRQALAPLPETSRAVLAALLLADRSRIPVHLIDAFAATGTAHLLAISGLHVGMTGALGFALCWWFFDPARGMDRCPPRACAGAHRRRALGRDLRFAGRLAAAGPARRPDAGRGPVGMVVAASRHTSEHAPGCMDDDPGMGCAGD
jgi:Predicted membrane metal-binding protein